MHMDALSCCQHIYPLSDIRGASLTWQLGPSRASALHMLMQQSASCPSAVKQNKPGTASQPCGQAHAPVTQQTAVGQELGDSRLQAQSYLQGRRGSVCSAMVHTA